jgi:hypothetical protein
LHILNFVLSWYVAATIIIIVAVVVIVEERGRQWRTGGFGVFTPPPKFRTFDKAEPNFQFC